MECIDQIGDMFVADTAVSVVGYFLANAQSWRGEVAREIKGDLNTLCALHFKSREVAK